MAVWQRILGGAMVLGLGAGAALAEAPTTVVNGTSDVTVWPLAFLTEDERAMLNLVQTNPDALSVFVPNTGAQGGYAALAVSPDDGFVRGGQLQASATALGGLSSAEEAAKQVLEACNAAKKGQNPCELVLAVAPR